MQSAANTTWLAPAKLNLFLHITGRRADGYHLLQTVFQLLDYGDELSFDINNTGVIAMRSPVAGVDDADNLIIRAARLLQTHTGCGSATTLRALNQLWQTGLSLEELATLGLQLGADVPVFVYGRTAWAEGVGEDLQAVTLPEQWFVVIKPADT